MTTKKGIFTIPNMLSFLRLALIPVFVVLYLTGHFLGSLICLMISFASDFLDGKLARALDQITELGVLLDPVADKFTQAAIVICLGIKYPILWIIFGIQIIKEGFMAAAGLITLKKRGVKLHKAAWYGKVSTGVTDGTLLLMLVFPDMPEKVRIGLIILCGTFMLLALALYIRQYIQMWKEPIPPENERATLI